MTKSQSTAEWFRAHNGKRVSKAITGITCSEDWDVLATKIIAELDANNTPYELTANELRWNHSKGQIAYSQRPALHTYQEGWFTVRSKDYGFLPDGFSNTVYGDKRGAVIVGDSMVKTYPDGMVITFTPLAAA